jgi:hypothetical protein
MEEKRASKGKDEHQRPEKASVEKDFSIRDWKV